MFRIMQKWLTGKSTVLICILLFPVMAIDTAAVNSSKADSLVTAGNQHYMDREYGKAIFCYDLVVSLGYKSASLFYNLGNAYYKRNDLPRAILYYEKARLLAPRDEDIRQNLAIANTRIIDKIDTIPEFFLKRWMNGLAGSLTPDQWALVSLFLFALALGMLFLYATGIRYGIRKTGFITAVFMIVFSLASLMLMFNRKQFIKHSRGAIVMQPVVNVKSSPDNQGTNVFLLHEGTRVTLMDSVQQWKEIRIPDGNKGWVPDSVLTAI